MFKDYNWIEISSGEMFGVYEIWEIPLLLFCDLHC